MIPTSTLLDKLKPREDMRVTTDLCINSHIKLSLPCLLLSTSLSQLPSAWRIVVQGALVSVLWQTCHVQTKIDNWQTFSKHGNVILVTCTNAPLSIRYRLLSPISSPPAAETSVLQNPLVIPQDFC